MFREKFKKAIEKYIASVNFSSPTELSRAKGVITRIANSATVENALEQIQEVLEGFGSELPKPIKNRFTPGSLYKEGNSVFGWYRPDQVQAEVIPVTITSDGLDRENYSRVTESRDGFEVPVDMPLAGGACVVSVPQQQSFFYAKYGWANACPLQWYRDEEGYKVDRSIIPHGFWQAWKWWEGARYWYLEKRPELFEDFDCWGVSWDEREKIHAAKPNSGDAVLGGANKNFWESKKFHLEQQSRH
jgi:hypothetical protein